MMGTFAAMLAKKRIPTPAERFRADVSGDIEAVDGVLKITRIAVRYTLQVHPTNVMRHRHASTPTCRGARPPRASSVVSTYAYVGNDRSIDRRSTFVF
jgi:hypothetical protein